MSGLNENEKKFVKNFLKILSDEAVQALAATVTRRMVKADTRKDCIDAILLHSTSLDEFLKRQKVTKEHLFRYLNDRKISVPNTDKSALEMQIKELVNGDQYKQSPPSSKSLVKRNSAPAPAVWTVPASASAPAEPIQQQMNFNMPSAGQVFLAAATQVTVQERVMTHTQVSGTNVFVNTKEPDALELRITNDFVKWFYNRVHQPGGVLSEDFWPDASLKLAVKKRNGNERSEKSAQGGHNVACLLNQTLEEHQLFLHPTPSSQGFWGRGNGEGLLLVLVCGTLHHRSSNPNETNCLGSFENLFLLAQDPFAENNWKIRNLQVLLCSNPHIQKLPTINDSELAKTIKL